MSMTQEASALVEQMLEDAGGDLTVHQRMVAILANLPAIGKSQRNEQQKFMYRGHDDVLNALNPLLAEWGVLIVPDVVERITAQRQTSKGGIMFEVNLHVRYRFYGMQGDYVEASAWGEGTDMGDKATNKAMTMAFKAVLAQAFAISTAENVDADAHTPEETVRRGDPKTGRITLARGLEDWQRRMEAIGVPADDALEWLRQACDAAGVDRKWSVSGKRANEALVFLSAEGFDLAFVPDPREVVRAAFQDAFDGAAVDGPSWRIHPSETDRPPQFGPPSAEELAEGESIPFGES